MTLGAVVSSVSHPAGANDSDNRETYRDGILTVSVGLPQAAPAEKQSSGASGA